MTSDNQKTEIYGDFLKKLPDNMLNWQSIINFLLTPRRDMI